jgi:hypothetical protein
MRRNPDKCLLVRHHAFGEHAIARAAELLHPQLGLNLAILPAREKRSGDPIAHRDAADTLADSDNLPGAVAYGHDSLSPRQGIPSVQD